MSKKAVYGAARHQHSNGRRTSSAQWGGQSERTEVFPSCFLAPLRSSIIRGKPWSNHTCNMLSLVLPRPPALHTPANQVSLERKILFS